MLSVKKNELLTKRKFKAGSVGECIDLVHNLHMVYERDDAFVRNPVMWFRGQSYNNYYLEPSLYRGLCDKMCSDNECQKNCRLESLNYGRPQIAEEIRYQNYRAKNIGLSDKGNEYSWIEWLEHMQHHGMKTRLLDWSESLIHSLLFAIEPLLNPKADPQKTNKISPHIWILFPQMLNANVLNILHGKSECDNPYADAWFERFGNISFNEQKIIKKHIFESLEDYKSMFMSNNDLAEDVMNVLFNIFIIGKRVSHLESAGILIEALKKQNYIHPLFPLINEFYMEGRTVDSLELPPLAFIQERHSKRIYSQRGVFTIFPFYRGSLFKDEPLRMESMDSCKGIIFKIELYNCEKIAYQLYEMGVTRDWLYPEDPIVSEGIEIG